MPTARSVFVRTTNTLTKTLHIAEYFLGMYWPLSWSCNSLQSRTINDKRTQFSSWPILSPSFNSSNVWRLYACQTAWPAKSFVHNCKRVFKYMSFAVTVSFFDAILTSSVDLSNCPQLDYGHMHITGHFLA